jgi:cytochrome c peroxidase
MSKSTPHQARRLLLTLAMTTPLVVAACDQAQSDVAETGGQAITSAQITQVYTNGSGSHQTISTTNNVDPNNPFFLSLGTNGRSCVDCHQPAQAWGISPAEVTARFGTTGTSPIFRLNDGSNAPNLPVATVAQRRAAYSLLMNRGVIRVGIGIPANAEFDLTLVEDPYHFASATELSLFRRPLPSTNLKFLSAVMWDGRETVPGAPIATDLSNQANDATLGHAQAATPLTAAQRQAIVDFESALFTAQITDSNAGSLTAAGATGGPVALSQQAFHIGINDVLGGDPTGAPFSTHVFNVFDAWAGQTGNAQAAARASIARGQNIFNTRTFNLSGVRGVNDVIGVANLTGTCTTCHDSPNAGDHSVVLPLDLGLTDADKFNTDTTPRYTLRNKTTGAIIRTSDPGRSLIDGKWGHVATFKGPILRGLAPRAPYFHNGFAATLADVVKFYDTRFHMGLDAQASADLAAFLAAL